jgi:hypothetical protein
MILLQTVFDGKVKLSSSKTPQKSARKKKVVAGSSAKPKPKPRPQPQAKPKAMKKLLQEEEEEEEELVLFDEDEESDDEFKKKKKKSKKSEQMVEKKPSVEKKEKEKESPSKKRTKKPKDPNMPKKGRSSYFIFLGERRASFVTENPTLPPAEIVRGLAEEWKVLSAEKKEAYTVLAQKERAAQDELIRKYVAEHPDAAPVKKSKTEAGAGKQEESKKKKRKDPNMPKKGRSAYMLFTAERRPGFVEENPALGPRDVVKGLAEEWNTLSEKHKEGYTVMAQKEREVQNALIQKYVAEHPDGAPAKKGKQDDDGKEDDDFF